MLKTNIAIVRICLFFLVLLVNGICARVEAQRPVVLQWEKSFGGSSDEAAYSILQSKDGGFLIAGRTFSVNGQVTNPVGDMVGWIVKTDEQGNLLWQKAIGKAGTSLYNLIETADGGIIVCGSVSTIRSGNTADDAIVVKLDASGNIQWEKNYGGSAQDIAYSIIQARNGDYVFAGFSGSDNGDIIDRKPTDRVYYQDWVVRLDQQGGIIWSRTYGGSNEEAARCLVETDDGSLLFAGGSYSNDRDITDYTGNRGIIWLVKTNQNGTIQWSKSYEGGYASYAYSIVKMNDGGYTIGGITDGNGRDVSNYHGGGGSVYDYWVIRTDAAGNAKWSKCYGGTNTDYLTGMVASKHGGFILAGMSSSSDGDVSTQLGNGDYWVVKIDDNGAITWSGCYGGSQMDNPQSVKETRDDGIVVAGFSYSSNGHKTKSFGSRDFWVVKLINKIETDLIAGTRHCAGDSITVTYKLYGVFNADNTLSVQLSDASGGFGNPKVLADFPNKNNESALRVRIPVNTAAGTKYRIRVVSSSPAAWYTDNGSDLSVQQAPVLPEHFLGKDTLLCKAGTLELKAPAGTGFQYTWQDNSSGTSFIASRDGSYILKVKNPAGCSVSDTIEVKFGKEPVFTLGNDISACAGENIELKPVLPAGDYLWKNGSKAAAITVNTEDWYWLEVADGGCTQRDSLYLSYKPLPVVQLGADIELCKGKTWLLDVTRNSATYKWQDGSVAPTYTVNAAGLYKVEVTENGCTGSDEINIRYKDVPSVKFLKDTVLCTGKTILLDASFPGATYKWQDGTTSSQLLVRQAGLYYVDVTNNCGTTRNSMRVAIKDCSCYVAVPGSFTPDNDGLNDTFKALSPCSIEKYELKVYNRYGQLIFVTRNAAIGWDGRFGAEPQPSGAFVWTLQYQEHGSGRMIHRKGSVLLMR